MRGCERGDTKKLTDMQGKVEGMRARIEKRVMTGHMGRLTERVGRDVKDKIEEAIEEVAERAAGKAAPEAADIVAGRAEEPGGGTPTA